MRRCGWSDRKENNIQHHRSVTSPVNRQQANTFCSGVPYGCRRNCSRGLFVSGGYLKQKAASALSDVRYNCMSGAVKLDCFILYRLFTSRGSRRLLIQTCKYGRGKIFDETEFLCITAVLKKTTQPTIKSFACQRHLVSM